jgi:hypothetical protein
MKNSMLKRKVLSLKASSNNNKESLVDDTILQINNT